MAVFLALAALLTLVVLAVLLRPLWRDARGVTVGIAIVVVACTALLYHSVGTLAALDPANHVPPQKLVEAAVTRANATPQRRFDAEGVALLERALRIEPEHQRARWFLGIARRQAGDAAAAAKIWEPLLPVVDAATAAALRPQIEAARRDAGQPPLPQPVRLQVRVSLDPDFASRVRLRDDTTVFVIAREPGGPPMPVAVEKHSISELPFTATLDDGDSPMPTRKLSQLREVELVARLSMSGIANKQDGDIESKPVRIALPSKGPVELFIGEPR